MVAWTQSQRAASDLYRLAMLHKLYVQMYVRHEGRTGRCVDVYGVCMVYVWFTVRVFCV